MTSVQIANMGSATTLPATSIARFQSGIGFGTPLAAEIIATTSPLLLPFEAVLPFSGLIGGREPKCFTVWSLLRQTCSCPKAGVHTVLDAMETGELPGK